MHVRTPTAKPWRIAAALFATLSVAIAIFATHDGAAAQGHGGTPPTQQLRTCVDRWNQGRMIDWGPSLAAVESSPHCTVMLAYVYERPPSSSCAPGVVWREHVRYCLDRHLSFVCTLNQDGAYECPG